MIAPYDRDMIGRTFPNELASTCKSKVLSVANAILSAIHNVQDLAVDRKALYHLQFADTSCTLVTSATHISSTVASVYDPNFLVHLRMYVI